jgi:transcriptional regulator with XRE-family HTH domain
MTTNRSDQFGRLLKGAINSIAAYEGKTAPMVEEELGQQIGVSGATIQRYKSGQLPPEGRAVQIMAEAAVRRGYLGREWLQRFLHAARYAAPDALLDELCPLGPPRQRSPRAYHNLPAPAYSQFVMRPQAYGEVIDGLQQRSAVVVLASFGGMGKTSLAREVAARCLKGDDAPRFDAVVWVSDKDHPGTTTLTTVLDEIARTLDYPGFTQYEHAEKQREVEQVLRRQRVLLVVDNFETIGDGSLLPWLLRLPEPSKALITTREYHRAFRRGGWPVELRGMTDDEAWVLIVERLRVLKMDRLVVDMAQLEPLMRATGGNPLALELALGLAKYERRPLQQVVDDLYAARGELFDDLFARSWALLDEAARRVLLISPLFPDATASAALAAAADIQGFAFERAVERLTDLALLDVEQADLDSEPRYVLHPLVRAFAQSKLRDQGGYALGAKERWVAYFQSFLKAREEAGWDAPGQFDLVEREAENLHAVLRACDADEQWQRLIEVVLAMRQFWSTRGYYDTRNEFVDRALRAARLQGDLPAHIQLLCVKVRALCYAGDVGAADECCAEARRLLEALPIADPQLVVALNQAQIRVCLQRGDYDHLDLLAQRNTQLAEQHGWRHALLYRYDLAEYLLRTGQLPAAEQLFTQLVGLSLGAGYLRAPIQGWLGLARIALQHNDADSAEQHLEQAKAQAEAIGHRRFLAECQRLYAELYVLRDDIPAARGALTAASDLYERLGMRPQLAELRQHSVLLTVS